MPHPAGAALAFAAALLCVAACQRFPTGGIEGTVRDHSGAPIANVHVGVLGLALSGPSDASGRYRLARVPVGTHRLRATTVGYVPLERDSVVVRKGVATRVDFTLDRMWPGLGLPSMPGPHRATNLAALKRSESRAGVIRRFRGTHRSGWHPEGRERAQRRVAPPRDPHPALPGAPQRDRRVDEPGASTGAARFAQPPRFGVRRRALRPRPTEKKRDLDPRLALSSDARSRPLEGVRSWQGSESKPPTPAWVPRCLLGQ